MGKSKKWQQLFTDATTRRQTSFTNLAISIQEEEDDDILTSLLLSSNMYSPNETSEAVVMAIVNTLKEKGELLNKWRETHRAMFGETDNHNIPSGDSMQMSKLAEGGVITTDTCTTARKVSRLLLEEIKKAVEANLEEGVVLNDRRYPSILQCRLSSSSTECVDQAMDIKITKYLTNILAGDLSNIHYWYRVVG